MTPAVMRQFGNLKKPAPPVPPQVAHRQTTATVVDVQGYNNITYPATNAALLDGAICYASTTPYVSTGNPNLALHLYYDLGAPKIISAVSLDRMRLIDYGTQNDGRSVVAGVWASNDASNWTLLGTGQNTEGSATDIIPISFSPVTARYLGYGVYSYWSYDGWIVIDRLDITAQA